MLQIRVLLHVSGCGCGLWLLRAVDFHAVAQQAVCSDVCGFMVSFGRCTCVLRPVYVCPPAGVHVYFGRSTCVLRPEDAMQCGSFRPAVKGCVCAVTRFCRRMCAASGFWQCGFLGWEARGAGLRRPKKRTAAFHNVTVRRVNDYLPLIYIM